MAFGMQLRAMMALTFAGLLLQPSVGAAAGWTGKGGRPAAPLAGYLLDDAAPALLFRCAGAGRMAMIVAGGAGLPRNADYTVVVSVDDVAYVEVTRGDSALAGDSDLVRIAPFASFQPLIAALKSGKEAEVSTPRGRYRVPLKGSGKALAILDGGCGA